MNFSVWIKVVFESLVCAKILHKSAVIVRITDHNPPPQPLFLDPGHRRHHLSHCALSRSLIASKHSHLPHLQKAIALHQAFLDRSEILDFDLPHALNTLFCLTIGRQGEVKFFPRTDSSVPCHAASLSGINFSPTLITERTFIYICNPNAYPRRKQGGLPQSQGD